MLKNLDKINYFSLKEDFHFAMKKVKVNKKDDNMIARLNILSLLSIIAFAIMITFGFNIKSDVVNTKAEFFSFGTYEHYEQMKIYSSQKNLEENKEILGYNNYKSVKKLNEDNVFPKYINDLKTINLEAKNILMLGLASFSVLFAFSLFNLFSSLADQKLIVEKFTVSFSFIYVAVTYFVYSGGLYNNITYNLFTLDAVYKSSMFGLFVVISSMTSVCYKAINSGNSLFTFRTKKAIEKAQSKAYDIMEKMDKELSKLNANPKLLKELNDYAALTKNENERIKILALFEELKDQDLRDGIQGSKRVRKHLENRAYINSITPQKREDPEPEKGFFKKLGLFQKENLA